MHVRPLFKTHYSLGRAIFKGEPPSENFNEAYSLSVFDIAKKYNLKTVVVVDDSISGFLELYQSSKKAGVKLVYGLSLNVVNDLTTKNEEMLKTLSKAVIFIKNDDGYPDLIKISSFYQKEGFYYHGNIDYSNLKRLWTKNLDFVIPFYDSFIFKNSLCAGMCVPNFPGVKLKFFIENSNLPFDNIMQQKVLAYAKSTNSEVIPARSVYYHKKSDIMPLLVYRCIRERTLLEKPELEHFSSNWFSFEKWQEQNSNPESLYL